MKTKHGVLMAGHSAVERLSLGSMEGRVLFHEPVQGDLTVTRLADIALARYITHVWVMPGAWYKEEKSHDQYSIAAYERHKHTATVSVFKRGSGHVDIIFPQYTAWYGVDSKKPGWIRGASPIEILGTISYMEQALGITIAGSPGGAGWSLLKKIHPEWIESVDVNLRDIHFTSKAGGDLVWQCPLPENVPMFLHKFDKGGAYPAAAASPDTNIGVGTPVHVFHGDGALRKPQDVGVWRCTIRYNGPAIPGMPPVWKQERGSYASGATDDGVWLAGPIIRLLRFAGHDVTIHEGYVFPEKHDVMVKWANLLWNARQGFKDSQRWQGRICADKAATGMKQIANSTIGFTAFRGFDEDEDEKRRPDIRLQIVSRNYELVWHNINKVRKLQHETPIMIYMDAVYYLSNASDGEAAFPVMMERKGELGGFKWEGRIEVTRQVREMFSKPMNVVDRLEYLNKIGWVK